MDRYTLVVQDYGGPVGMRLAVRHPDRVDALIVQKPYLIGYTAATYMIEYLTRGTQPEQYTYLEPCIAYYDDLENPEINQYFYDAVE